LEQRKASHDVANRPGAAPPVVAGEGRLGDLRVRAFKLDKAFREVLVVMQKVSGPVGAGAYPALA
jgi:hypothetical protein